MGGLLGVASVDYGWGRVEALRGYFWGWELVFGNRFPRRWKTIFV